MIKIAVCEDEKIFREYLKNQVHQYFLKQKEKIALDGYASGESLKAIEYQQYDLIFLDVDLKEAEDGINVARYLREKGYMGAIVFLTSHQEEAYKAFEVEAFRYLLKPLEEEALESALQEVVIQIKKKQMQTLKLKSGQTLLQLRTEDIVYIESFERKLKIHTVDDIYFINEKMKEVEAKIKDPYFFKIHKAFLVNFRHIKEHTDIRITMMNDQVLYISRLKLASFKKAFMAYLLEE